MILPDVNVLIYAFRSDSADHERYRTWLESVVNAPQAYGISPQVLASVVRIVSHPRIFVRPSRVADAFAFARTLMDQPNATIVLPRDRHWAIFERLCEMAAATGNLVQDAWYAALAIESGCEWITTDRDYARFPDLRWQAP
ncbi:MAG: type II toxin-antitoxin system VapC family toxin [Burkholderiales bacterium]